MTLTENDLRDLASLVAKVQKHWTVSAYQACLSSRDADISAILVAQRKNDGRFYTIRAHGNCVTQADVEFGDRTDSLDKAIALIPGLAKSGRTLIGDVVRL